jgi:O-antigen/teichoic acid export membrane protein
MSENKKIAKNSIILYGRLLVTSIIGLYASRLVLKELGVEDFGIYGVVGGIVGMLNFLNSSMIATSNRFIAIELGKTENKNLNKVFNTVVVIHILLGLLIVIFGELIGSWYIINHLNIPFNKVYVALYVLHFSIGTAALATFLVPFQGLLTAHEQFNVKASLEILQSGLHLVLLLFISFIDGNKLENYALLVFLMTVFIFIIYIFYSINNYKEEIKWRFNNSKSDYYEISRFLGWTMFYVLGATGSKQGATLILNSFFGTTLNAANAIASRVFEFVYSFVKNLNQAAVPQIMKNYSAGNQGKSVELIYNLSRFTFFIMFIPTVPLLLSIDTLLKFWLDKVPQFSSVFAILMLIHGLICCLESGFDACIDSTGRIKKTKIIFNIIMMCTLPVLYLLYTLGFPPYILSVVTILAELIFLLFQLQILQTLTSFKIKDYLNKTVSPVSLVVLWTLPQIYIRNFFGQDFFSVLLFTILSVVSTMLVVFQFGLNRNEREALKDKLNIIKNNVLKY